MNLLKYERKAIWAKVKAGQETVFQGIKEYWLYCKAVNPNRHEFKRLITLAFWCYIAML